MTQEPRSDLPGAIVAAPVARIMVVDDDADIRRMLRLTLTTRGYSVLEASGGEEALARLDEFQPDVMFVDVSMPGVGGLEVLEQVRARKLDVAVIMATAYGSEQIAMEALRRGADNYLPKPFRPAEFQMVLDRTVARLHLSRQNLALHREAARARRMMRAILDSTSEAMALISLERVVLSANRNFGELLFGVSSDEMVGRSLDAVRRQLAGFFDDPAALDPLWDSLDDPERRLTQIVTRSQPERREYQVFTAPVRGDDEEHLGRLYVFRDITHEREVDRMKSEFVSLVSHELRTPLTSIKGYMDLLLEGEAGALSEMQQEFIGIAKNNADRLVALINDLLDVARIEEGRINLQRTAVDLTRLIPGVAMSLRPNFQAKEQRLTLELAPGLPPVWGDFERVTQILTNLLSNAHKYTPAGGSITVAARAAEEWVQVEVRDSGIGMSSEEQAQLFTRFFRARNRATQEAGGTGLGLVITRSLVEMHGGEISVVSAPGHGSTFRFTLPVDERTVDDSRALSGGNLARPGSSNPAAV